MKNRLVTSVGLPLALAVLLATPAGAESRRDRDSQEPLRGARSFTISGPCTACFGGEIRIDGASYRLSPGALIYEAGRGFLPSGTSLTGRVVCLSGVKVGDTLVPSSVLVRPAPDPAAGAPPGGPVSVQEASRPQ